MRWKSAEKEILRGEAITKRRLGMSEPRAGGGGGRVMMSVPCAGDVGSVQAMRIYADCRASGDEEVGGGRCQKDRWIYYLRNW